MLIQRNIKLRAFPAHRPTSVRSSSRCVPRRLAEVGKLEAPRPTGKYDTGQLFLHRVFGYRGVVLFPWQARVYDRDTQRTEDKPPAG